MGGQNQGKWGKIDPKSFSLGNSEGIMLFAFWVIGNEEIGKDSLYHLLWLTDKLGGRSGLGLILGRVN